MKAAKTTYFVLSLIMISYVLFLAFMPTFILQRTSIYHISAASFLPNSDKAWLIYSLSFLAIPAILFAFYPKKNLDVNLFQIIFLFLIFKELVRLLEKKTNIFDYNDYSIVFCYLIALGCFVLLNNLPKYKNYFFIIDLIIVLNFFTQLLFITTGRKSDDGNRYSALGSSYGDVGVMCFQYIGIVLFLRQKPNYLTIFCSTLSLIISGSRANIIFTLLLVCVYFFVLFFNEKDKLTKVLYPIMMVILFGIVIIFTYFYDPNRTGKMFSDILNGNVWSFLESDLSLNGRLKSFHSGFLTIFENPFGISMSAIDLQVQTIKNGFDTFPHSYFVSQYLLWGVGTFFIAPFYCYFFIKAIQNKQYRSLILAIILAIHFFSFGGPVVNVKMLLWWMIVLSMFRQKTYLIPREQSRTLKSYTDYSKSFNTLYFA